MMLVGTQTVHAQVHPYEAWSKLKPILLRKVGIMPSWRYNSEKKVFEDDVSHPRDSRSIWETACVATPEQITIWESVQGIDKCADFKSEYWRNAE